MENEKIDKNPLLENKVSSDAILDLEWTKKQAVRVAKKKSAEKIYWEFVKKYR